LGGNTLQKSAAKASKKIDRQLKQQRKQNRMKMIMWLTGICFVVLIALAVILRPSSTMEFNYAELPMKGKADAPVKIVEFGDYQCPACKVFTEQIVPQLQKDYIDTGVASFYFANRIIIGPDSYPAAYAAQSVYHQNKDEFWKYYELLYKNQGAEGTNWVTTDFLVDLAKQNGIQVDYEKLRSDIENKTYEDEVSDHNALAKNGGINSTPTLIINGEKFDDVFDYEKIKAAIEAAK
jgi:protein-disulfide isomerase